MKILLTGGGSGGHFYPVVSVAEMINLISEQEKIARVEVLYMSDTPYNKELLLQHGIIFKKTFAGKIRRYFSFLNFIDVFKTLFGIIKSVWSIFGDFPDVIFSKGGYASFPAVVSARIFGIPLLIHETDVVPGKVNQWAGKFAKRVAISFPEASKYFKEEKIALTGTPIRREFFTPVKRRSAEDFLNLEPGVPTILVLGGSTGARNINENILDILPELLENYQIIHQCGKANLKEMKERVELVLEKTTHKTRYHLFDYLDLSYSVMAFGATDLVVSRAGGTSISEIAATGLPSLMIPLTGSAQDHQKENAYAYARIGAADVLEEENLTPHVLLAEIRRLFGDKEKLKKMGEEAKKFSKPDAAEKIAREIIELALSHS